MKKMLPKTESGASVGSMELLAADVTPEMLHAPCDASARRARFERHERYNAFQDGAIEWVNSPQGQTAIAKARDAALARIQKRKAANAKDQAQPPTIPK